MREEGFFVGAILINVVTTELFILALYLVCVVGFSTDYKLMLSILFVAAITFPVAFYHHSWSLWLGLDHVIESLPQNASWARIEPKEEWPDRIDV